MRQEPGALWPAPFGAGGVIAECPAGLHATYAFLWVAVAHAVQYLWITAYYQKTRRGLWSARVLLAGAAVWVLPALMFAPALFGSVPYDAGLGLLVAAVVNLHHFVLDGAIWKLRDGQVARILLRGEPAEYQAPAPGRWPSRLVWVGGVASVLVWCASTLEQAFGLEQAHSRVRDGQPALVELLSRHVQAYTQALGR